MAKARRVKWECPHGLHPAVLGSTRPAREATVRFCWACSEEAGVLVRRRAPVLEARRQRATFDAEAKRRLAAERERDRKAAAVLVPVLAIAGSEAATGEAIVLDAGVLLREAWGSAAVREACTHGWGNKRPRLPEFTVRRGTAKMRRAKSTRAERSRDRVSGHSKGADGAIVLTCGPGLGEEWLRAIVVHEAVHSALPSGDWHGDRWQRYYMRAMRELYGVEPGVLVSEMPAWRLDELMADALREA